MDSASYHKLPMDTVSNFANKTYIIVEWLATKGYPEMKKD